MGGRRPFGVSNFLTGFEDGAPKLFLTEPSGALSQWKASAIGKKSKELKELLEEKYTEGLDQDATLRLTVQTLMEVVESEKNIEVNVMRGNNVSETIDTETIGKIVAAIN